MENGFSGLLNLGNTCYLNATIQLLSHIFELNFYIKEHNQVTDIPDSILVKEWFDLYNLMWSKNCTISPNRFVYNVKELSKIKNSEFSNDNQNDAVEYFYFVIDCIHNSYNLINDIQLKRTNNIFINNAIDTYETKNKSIIHSLFTSFTLTNYTNQYTNEDEFNKIEPCFTIELSIPHNSTSIVNVTLKECFEETFKIEHMQDLWLDDKTGIRKKIKKQTYLCYLPDILVIHLKRWNYDLRKNNTIVSFDENINIFEYTIYNEKDDCNYELFGIINHQGNVLGGHYFSYIKKQNWYSFDDSTITKIEPSTIINNKNYCLFYRKIK